MTTNPCDEMESGCVISDSRRGGYSLARSGRYVGDFNEYVNDHGNVDLLTYRVTKRGKVTTKLVQSWV